MLARQILVTALGDLLFYSDYCHVAIYSGNRKIIEAPHTGDVVHEVPMGTPIAVRFMR